MHGGRVGQRWGARAAGVRACACAGLAAVVASPLRLGNASAARALSTEASPTPAGSAGGDVGVVLVAVVVPVMIVALVWLGYIFWLIFHEGENVGAGGRPGGAERGRRNDRQGTRED